MKIPKGVIHPADRALYKEGIIKTKAAKREYLTHGMAKTWRRMPINVSICVQPAVLRRGPPEVGKCFFDAEGRMIYVIGGAYMVNGRLSNHFDWKRVFTDGTLSQKTYSGYWQWGDPVNNAKKPTSKRRAAR